MERAMNVNFTLICR